jgi:hypothetical protein
MERIRERLTHMELPSRAAEAERFSPVDITRHLNRSAVDDEAYDGEGWIDLGPGMDLSSLPSGRRVMCGVPFDVADGSRRENCIMLAPPRAEGSRLPSRVTGIPVRRRAASLVFLHCLTGRMEARATAPAMVYDVAYADGTAESFPVHYRIEVMEWLDASPGGGKVTVAADGSTVGASDDGGAVAKSVTGDLRMGWFLLGARPSWLGRTRCGKRVILYGAEWVNPHPDKEIASFGVAIPEDSTAPGAALFAATAVGIR